MRSRIYLRGVWLVGALGIAGLTAGEPVPPLGRTDAAKAKPADEEKEERLLETLIARCQKMIDLQTALYDRTKALHKLIEANPDKEPSPADRQAAVMLSESAKAIVSEATKAIILLEKEGAAVAFPEVFHELRKDMEAVQRRLEMGDTGSKTQDIEVDIIDTLKEMIGAVKR